jgi:hypothetical protein
VDRPGRDGTEHTGPISVRRPAAAGSAVQVWVDADGQSVDEPAQPLGAVLAGAGAAAGVLTAGGALVYLLWSAVRALTGAVNDRRWEREWARVEPEWRGHVR